MQASANSRIRPLGRGTFLGGIAATLLIHASLAGLIYYGQLKNPPRPEAARDMIVTRLVALGKPREKFWLPRIVQPPKPAPTPALKLSEDPNAAPAPKEAPKLEDTKISKDLRKALERAKALAAQAGSEEPAEGSLTGSAEGTANQAAAGDEYATAIFEAIRGHWSTPTGLVSDSELATLSAEIRVSISPEGKLGSPRVLKPSGNQYFDDSCVQAINATVRVPPPPEGLATRFKRGTLLVFSGKDLAR
jgi:TonB family protein